MNLIPLLLGVSVATAILLLFFGIRYSDPRRVRELQGAMIPVVRSKEGLLKETDEKVGLWTKWMTAWEKASMGAGNSDIVASKMGIIVIVMSVIVAGITFALTGVIVLSVFVSLGPAAFLWLRLTGKAGKRSVQIEKQMSSFVVSIHMYIQSGLQPVTAILQAVEACPDPLKSELTYLVVALKNNENERTAFRNLRDRTANYELKELCSNISIALSEGSDIGKQLMNLGETVRAKGELRGKIQNLLQDPRMTAVIGFLSFFIFFIISWVSQPDAQAVWSTLLGSIVLAVASGMAAFGGWWAFRIIKKAASVA